MSFIIHKEINSEYYLAFKEDELFKRKSGGVAIVKRTSDGAEKQMTPPIFSPSFIETVPFPEGHVGRFYHLHVNRETVDHLWLYDEDFPDFLLGKYDSLDPSHNDLYGSYLFLADFSEHVRFELLFDRITLEREEVGHYYMDFLVGSIGGMTFKGYAEFLGHYGRPMSIIPIKYQRIIFGGRYFVAAYDGQGWDIYDNYNMDGNRVHYKREDRYGDNELDPDYHSYYEYYSCCKQYSEFDPESKRRLLYRRLLRTKVASVTDSLDEPYPITDTGSIDLIGVAREVDGDSVFSEVVKSPYPIRDYTGLVRFLDLNNHNGDGPDYYYIVTQNNKKGLWHNEIVDKTYQNSWRTSKYTLYGIGKKALDCQYLDICPIIEDYERGNPRSYRACNSFSIKSESGWGVYDGLKGRTLLPPVFDEPASVILGPEGYICKINGKYGIVDKNGNQFLPFIYDEIKVIDEDVENIQTNEDGDFYTIIKTKVKCLINGDISEYTFTYDDRL